MSVMVRRLRDVCGDEWAGQLSAIAQSAHVTGWAPARTQLVVRVIRGMGWTGVRRKCRLPGVAP